MKRNRIRVFVGDQVDILNAHSDLPARFRRWNAHPKRVPTGAIVSSGDDLLETIQTRHRNRNLVRRERRFPRLGVIEHASIDDFINHINVRSTNDAISAIVQRHTEIIVARHVIARRQRQRIKL